MPKTIIYVMLSYLSLAIGLSQISEVKEINNSRVKSFKKVESKKHILLINSYHQGFKWTDELVLGVQKAFKESSQEYELYIENLDTKRIGISDEWLSVLKGRLDSYPVDLIDLLIVADDNALNTLIKTEHQLFKDKPIVFCGVSHYLPEKYENITNLTGIVQTTRFDLSYKLAKEFFPDIKNLIIITDNSTTGKGYKEFAMKEFSDLQDVNVIWLDGAKGLSTEMLINELRQLPRNSIVLMGIWQREGGEHIEFYYDMTHVYPELSKAANMPMLAVDDLGLGNGILGGVLNLGEDHGYYSAKMGIDILKGKPIKDIPIKTEGVHRYCFDWKQMKRWGINEDMLPVNAYVINKPVTLYQQYKEYVWITIVSFSILLFMLILTILYHFRYRRSEKSRYVLEHKNEILAKRYQLVFDQSLTPVFLYNYTLNRIVAANQSASLLFGYDVKEFLQLSILDLFVNPIPVEKKMKQKSTLSTYEQKQKGKAGNVVYSQIAQTYFQEEENEFFFIILMDRTMQKEYEGNLRKAKDKAEESDHLKTLFLESMSHEIRTPLNAIVGFSEIINLRLQDDKFKKISEAIRENNNLLLSLIGDMIEFAKIESGEITLHCKNTIIEELLNEIVKLHKPNVSADLQMTVELENVSGNYYTDPHKIKQIINQLVSNALKFTSKGRIVIRAKTINEGLIEFSVSDTGKGIPQEKLKKIFDRFIKLSQFTQGTGLGLSIVKKLVDKMGGDIWVESVVGKGSIFRFTIKTDLKC